MDNNINNSLTGLQQSQQQQQLAELIQTLEQATLMAKQLPATADPDHHRLIFSSLSSAQLSISSFLSIHHHNNCADNSVSSAAVADDETMIAADDGDEEQMSKDSSMDRVEERLRDSLYIQNKRPKRPLSPSSVVAVERRQLEERENFEILMVDPVACRLRNLDLVYQFHG